MDGAKLFPFSDIDIVVLVKDDTTPAAEQAAIAFVQRLWTRHNAVSHATRTIHASVAAARADPAIAASLLDARYVAGDLKAFRALKKALKREVFGANARGFIAAKLKERDGRHARWGDSRFMLEPNVKEGKGGLRDLQTLDWIATYCGRARRYLLSPAEWKQHREAMLFFRGSAGAFASIARTGG